MRKYQNIKVRLDRNICQSTNEMRLFMKTNTKNSKVIGVLLVVCVTILVFIDMYVTTGVSLSKNELTHRTPIKISHPMCDKEVVEAKQVECISNWITNRNSKVTEEKANKWAKRIILRAKQNNYSTNIHTALIDSESNWEENPKHIYKYDKGMTGINTKVWGDVLKEAGIIKSIKDLEDPLIAIDASSWIYTYYLKHYDYRTFHALAGYKSYCEVGKRNARKVIELAYVIKNKGKNV
jgi:hypothetical protein